jgi:hypothetical protein
MTPRHPALLEPVDLRDAVLLASEDAQHLPALLDHDPSTAWTAGSQSEAWLEVRFARKTPVSVVDLRMVVTGGEPPPQARLGVLGPDGSLRTASALDARPTFAEQRDNARHGSTRPFGQRLLLDGSPILGLRIERTTTGRAPWTLAELEVEVDRTPRP